MPGSLPRRVKRRRPRQRRESLRKHMPQRDQRKRPPLISDPERRPKEQKGSSDALISKYEEIIAAAEKLQGKERIHAEMSKRLEDTEAILTRAVKKMNENQRLIREQARLIK